MATLTQTQTFAQLFAAIEAESRFESMVRFASAAWVEHQDAFRCGRTSWPQLLTAYANVWGVDLAAFPVPAEPALPHADDFDEWVEDMEEWSVSTAMGFSFS